MKSRSPSLSVSRSGRFFSGRAAGIFCAAALLAGVPCVAHAQTTYTWNLGSTGGNWAVPADWNPTAPATGPTAGDTAILGDNTGTRVVVYDSGASGSLGSLQINETSGGINELQLGKSLTLTSALALGSTNGSAVLDLQSFALTAPSLTLNGGGSLLIGANAEANSTSGTVVSGNLALSGGSITTNSAVGTGNGTITATISGTFTMSGGALNLTQSSTGGVRFAVSNGVNITGGTLNYTGTNTGNGGLNEFYMSGTTSNVLGNAANPVTITTTNSSGVVNNTGTGASGNGAEITLNNNGTESLSYNLTAGSAAFDLHSRSTAATATVVHTLNYTGTAAAGPIGTLYLNQTFGSGGNSSAISTLKLGSNLATVAASTSTLILARDPQATSTGVLNLDLAGFTLNGSAVTGGLALTSVTSGTDTWTLNSSTGTAGTLQAANFNFNAGASANLRLTVGANVVLQATGTAANDFRVTTPTAGTSTTSFDPASTFLYTGTGATINTVGTGATPTLGKVTVGDGTNASVLTLASNLTTAGAVTINRGSTLALVANTLTAPTAGITIAGGANLNTSSVLTQTLINQIASASGTSSSPAYLNITASQTLGSTLDLNTPGLTNVSIGGNYTLTATAGQITPANSTYQFGSTTGTFGITGAGISGNNNLVINGSVRIGSSNASYTGSTTINAGTLSATTNTRIPVTAMTVNSGGTFDLVNTDGGTTQTLTSLAGAGTVTNTSTTANGGAPAKTLVVNGSAATTFSGTITEGGSGGTLALTRAGTGTLTLSGTSNYTGGTSVTGGTLLINAANTGGGAVTLSGGTLGGMSALSGALAMTGGTITGGTAGGVGMLTLTSNASLGGGTYQVDVSGASSDRLIFSGGSALSVAGTTLTINGTLDGATTYVIATYGSETGNFASTNVPAGYTVNYGTTEIDLVPTAVPEPSTWFGGAVLLAGLGWRVLRRQRAVA